MDIEIAADRHEELLDLYAFLADEDFDPSCDWDDSPDDIFGEDDDEDFVDDYGDDFPIALEYPDDFYDGLP